MSEDQQKITDLIAIGIDEQLSSTGSDIVCIEYKYYVRTKIGTGDKRKIFLSELNNVSF